MERPTTIAELRRFLGMVNFYHRFIKNAAAHQSVLQDLTKDCRKKDHRKITWTPETIAAFVKCREVLADATLLAHPSHYAELSIAVDASSTAVGAVLQQKINEAWQPLGFFSKKLTDTQRNYSVYDRELLAAYSAIKHFRTMLEGRPFILFTDHKPLTFAFSRSPNLANFTSPRQQRHLDYISQFTTDIRYIKGVDNSTADLLSRLSTISVPNRIDYEIMANAQQHDSELRHLRNSNTSLILKSFSLPSSATLLWCDISTGQPRPFVPLPFRKDIFDNLHNLSHPGTRATVRLVRQRFVWPGISKDCTKWTQACISCQKSKIVRHTRTPVGRFPLPKSRFSHVHIDIIGPLPPSNGYNYCLTCVDRFTRWPEAIPLPDTKTESVANAFYAGWVARFGVPATITTDQGRQFESALFTALTKFLGSHRIHTTAYHPVANGMVERFHRTLKAALRCHSAHGRWTEVLPTVLLGLRASLGADVDATPADFTYGSTLRLPGEFFFAASDYREDPSTFVFKLKKDMEAVRPKVLQRHGNTPIFVHKSLMNVPSVFLRDDSIHSSLQRPYEGPFRVISRSDKTFVINRNGKYVTVSIDRLKPAFTEAQAKETCVSDVPGIRKRTRFLLPSAQVGVLWCDDRG